jgi:phosphatidylglycerol---prolipoprotein diacylglyceryl transferase
LYWHVVFDLIGSISAFLMTVIVYRWRLEQPDGASAAAFSPGYAIALVVGAASGGYGFGTLNLMLTDVPGIGRSIVGALAGTIVAVELYKAVRGISGSTGLVFVAGFSTTVMIGRIGCLLSGIDDQTYGIATNLPWAWDFGDGVARHPVPLYESASMAAFLIFALVSFANRAPFFMKNGFYLLVGFYGAQRFVWEFLKPYATVIGPLNVFHMVCLALIAYAFLMIMGKKHD